MLSRSYMDEDGNKSLLAYSPMIHARLFKENPKFRDSYFQPTKSSLVSTEKSAAPSFLDGNPAIDRPLIVQFCANQPDDLLEAARYVAPFCDAVDLNLGCPQGIARSGNYGAFLQEDWDTIHKLINKLHRELSIPVTAKMRILETKEKTLEYAKMIVSAGASILTVHGRRREQKGHNMGVADWAMIRYLRANLPADTVIFANGNILNRDDIQPCLEATGADGIMSAEGNLSDPTIFAKPPTAVDDREYWRGSNGQEGYRIDGIVRRYLDIIYKYVLEQEPPRRSPLYIPSDPEPNASSTLVESNEETSEPPAKRRRQDKKSPVSPSLKALQGHLFHLFRPFISTHTDIRDALARSRAGDMEAFEIVLTMLESAVKKSLQEEVECAKEAEQPVAVIEDMADQKEREEVKTSRRTIAKYKRPWFVCQPYIRPLPEEAMEKGALQVSKKEKAKMASKQIEEGIRRTDEPSTEVSEPFHRSELPQPALICG
jgi:tRNA-dihydrouridine synthase 1